MKELTIEQKAQRYDEAIKRIQSYVVDEYGCTRIKVVNVFPELVESEDERIRQALIHFISEQDGFLTAINGISVKKIIAWLEKQGKNNMGISEATKKELENNLNKALEKETPESCNEFLEKQGNQKYENICSDCINIKGCVNCENGNMKETLMQKSADSYCKENCKGYQESGKCFADGDCKAKREAESIDKAEPKFKVGDWIVNNTTKEIFKITELIDFGYESIDENGKGHALFIEEDEYHLWSIQDAKDGDVLACKNDIVIFKENNYNPEDKSGCMFVRCSLCNKNGYWRIIGGINPSNYVPATKEQRDTIEKAMHDAGYVWDTEKLELKKKADHIPADKDELNPVWSEEDTFIINKILYICNYYEKSFEHTSFVIESIKEDVNKIDNWLKSLKDRVQPKQEWSEEDKEMIIRICQKLYDYPRVKSPFDDESFNEAQEEVQFIKSLGPNSEWKPTREQLVALEYYMHTLLSTEHKEVLFGLYNDLKQLKDGITIYQ